LKRCLKPAARLAGALDLPSLLKTVMELAARVVRADSGSILLKDESTGELMFDVAWERRAIRSSPFG
jgi:GAF domain-containing protein